MDNYRKGAGRGQNLKKVSPIDLARRELQNEYYIVGFWGLSMANWQNNAPRIKMWI